jgi:hypothetical protein
MFSTGIRKTPGIGHNFRLKVTPLCGSPERDKRVGREVKFAGIHRVSLQIRRKRRVGGGLRQGAIKAGRSFQVSSVKHTPMGNKPTRIEEKKDDTIKREKILAKRYKVTDKIIGKGTYLGKRDTHTYISSGLLELVVVVIKYSGSFATVLLGHDMKTKKKVAIRQIPTSGLCAVTLQHLYREVELHPTMDHDNIVRVLHTEEEEDGTITMVLEYVKDGSLLDYYAKKRGLHEFEVRSIFLQLLDAVSYMHSKGIVHRYAPAVR